LVVCHFSGSHVYSNFIRSAFMLMFIFIIITLFAYLFICLVGYLFIYHLLVIK